MTRHRMMRSFAVAMLLGGMAASRAQTYTFDPQNPQPGDPITVEASWPYSGNFVMSQGVLQAGAEDGGYITVWFVQDGANFAPNPPVITASQVIPGQAAGNYVVNVYWVPDPAAYSRPVSAQTFTLNVGGVPPPPFEIGPGITGNWYDRDESGHGFSLEVLPNGILLAEWFVYAPLGGRDWIIGTGAIFGDTAVVDAWQVTGAGGRFPPDFDAAGVQSVPWGSMTFTFSDCNHGTVGWQPTAPGYSAGTLPITRLTMPDGLSCN